MSFRTEPAAALKQQEDHTRSHSSEFSMGNVSQQLYVWRCDCILTTPLEPPSWPLPFSAIFRVFLR